MELVERLEDLVARERGGGGGPLLWARRCSRRNMFSEPGVYIGPLADIPPLAARGIPFYFVGLRLEIT